MKQKYILIADDSLTVLKMIEGLLSLENFNLDICRDGAEAKLMIQNKQYDLIISDEEMPFLCGSDLARWIRSENITTPFILLSGRRDPRLFADLLANRVITVMVPKPFQHTSFVHIVCMVLGIKEKPKHQRKSI